MPEQLKQCINNMGDAATVMDDLIVPRYARQAAGLGPIFVYPVKPDPSAADILDTHTAINQISSFIVDKPQREEIAKQLHTQVDTFIQNLAVSSCCKAMQDLQQHDQFPQAETTDHLPEINGGTEDRGTHHLRHRGRHIYTDRTGGRS